MSESFASASSVFSSASQATSSPWETWASAPSRTTERTVAPSAKLGIWGTRPTETPPWKTTAPSSGVVSPARIERSVDFPAPFGPIRPIRSPGSIPNERAEKRSRAPNAFDRRCAATSGGMARR